MDHRDPSDAPIAGQETAPAASVDGGEDVQEATVAAIPRTAQPQDGTPRLGEPPTKPLWVDALPTGSLFASYRIERMIGQGGMGVVYEATDPVLQRRVALKLLRSGGLEESRRFLKEARAQARLEHPHVCRIYEADVHAGVPYIAMQQVHGSTLGIAARTMTVEQLAAVMGDIAEAVHAANRLGLIHRDLKPSNIMVESTDKGEICAYVMDFGLARETGAGGLTVSHAGAGTPHFMAPEQVAEDPSRLDRRTDVYGLGATMYALFAGSPPFGDLTPSAAMARRLEHEPPPPVRLAPRLPRDLNTIVMRCLALEPARRYDSAREVAEELQRFLDGEPIHARPTGLIERLATRARRRPRAAAALLAGALVMLVLAGIAIESRVGSARRARLAQELGQRGEALRSSLRIAHLLPVHDIRPTVRQVRAEIARLAARLPSLDSRSAAITRTAIGRAWLTLGEHRQALPHLHAAQAEGAESPELSLALGQALAAAYRDAREEALQLPAGEPRAARFLELDRTLREPALAHLNAARGVAGESPALVAAWVAFSSNQPQQAVARSEEVATAEPALYEGFDLQGLVHMDQGLAYHASGDYEAAMARYEEAGRCFARALAVGQSDPGLLEHDAERLFRQMEVAFRSGGSPEVLFATLQERCRTALRIDQDRPISHLRLAMGLYRMGRYAAEHGRDPRSLLGEAESSVTAALALDERSSRGWLVRGAIASELAAWAVESGQDPEPMWAAAASHLERATILDPHDANAFAQLGYVNLDRGEHACQRGHDPHSILDAATTQFRQAIALAPAPSHIWYNNIAYAHEVRGRYDMERGRDPLPSFDASLAANREALAINPKAALTHSNLAMALVRIGQVKLGRGLDPGPELHEALQHLQESIAIDPKSRHAWNNRGFIYVMRAEWALARNADPRTDLDAALAALAECTRVDPRFPSPKVNRSVALVNMADWAIRHNRPADGMLAEAERSLKEALAVNATHPPALIGMVRLHLASARAAEAAGRSPERALGEAQAAYLVARERAGAKDAVHERGAEAWLATARVLRRRGAEPAQAIEQGQIAARRALELNPANQRARALLGCLLAVEAAATPAGTARTSHAAQAATELRAALEANPNLQNEFSAILQETEQLASASSRSS